MAAEFGACGSRRSQLTHKQAPLCWSVLTMRFATLIVAATAARGFCHLRRESVPRECSHHALGSATGEKILRSERPATRADGGQSLEDAVRSEHDMPGRL